MLAQRLHWQLENSSRAALLGSQVCGHSPPALCGALGFLALDPGSGLSCVPIN